MGSLRLMALSLNGLGFGSGFVLTQTAVAGAAGALAGGVPIQVCCGGQR